MIGNFGRINTLTSCLIFSDEVKLPMRFFVTQNFEIFDHFNLTFIVDCITMVARPTPYEPNRGIPFTVKAEA